jgi:hypothetical protein
MDSYRKVKRRIVDTIEPIAQQELKGDFKTAYDVPSNNHNVKNYYPLLNSINFFSWYPHTDSQDQNLFFLYYLKMFFIQLIFQYLISEIIMKTLTRDQHRSSTVVCIRFLHLMEATVNGRLK